MNKEIKEYYEDTLPIHLNVTRDGVISRGDNGTVLKYNDNGNGYKIVVFGLGDKVYSRYVHRIIATVYLDNPDNLPQVGHRDDDKENNSPENLYWCTNSQNIRDAHRTGRMDARRNYGPTRRYEEDFVEEAYRKVMQYGEGIGETARLMGFPRTTLSSIINKRSWAHLTDRIDKEIH